MKQTISRILRSPMSAYLASFFGVIWMAVANAQQPPAAPTLVNSWNSLNTNLWCPIVNAMFWVLITISIIMVLWAAYLYVIAGDDSEKPTTARRMLLYAAIGIVVALIAKGFPLIVSSVFNATGSYQGLGC